MILQRTTHIIIFLIENLLTNSFITLLVKIIHNLIKYELRREKKNTNAEYGHDLADIPCPVIFFANLGFMNSVSMKKPNFNSKFCVNHLIKVNQMIYNFCLKFHKKLSSCL